MKKLFLALAELKTSLARLSSYTTAPTFLLLLALWLEKIWNAHWQRFDYQDFMFGSIAIILLLGIIIQWIDRRFVWPQESSIAIGVHPLTVTECFRSAWVVAQLEKEGFDTSHLVPMLRDAFVSSGWENEFDNLLESFRVHQKR